MRLWHIALIEYLPKKQLLSQWRECIAISSNLVKNGTPNHVLVNRILEYPSWHFLDYGLAVAFEMVKRGYTVSEEAENKFKSNVAKWESDYCENNNPPKYNYETEIFKHWHNDEYMTQCYYNLEEKYNCGGISEEEFDKFKKGYELHINQENVFSIIKNLNKEELSIYFHNIQLSTLISQRAKESDEWLNFFDKNSKTFNI